MNSKEMEESIEKLSTWFLANGKSLAVAESCTGGLFSSFITERPGVSQFFVGSVVSYAASVKINILGVPAHLIQSVGEVSLPVALEMARGVRFALDSDWSLAITGIAGPGGGTTDKPVGTVCFAVCGPGFERTEMKKFENINRKQIQFDSSLYAAKLLLESIHS